MGGALFYTILAEIETQLLNSFHPVSIFLIHLLSDIFAQEVRTLLVYNQDQHFFFVLFPTAEGRFAYC